MIYQVLIFTSATSFGHSAITSNSVSIQEEILSNANREKLTVRLVKCFFTVNIRALLDLVLYSLRCFGHVCSQIDIRELNTGNYIAVCFPLFQLKGQNSVKNRFAFSLVRRSCLQMGSALSGGVNVVAHITFPCV